MKMILRTHESPVSLFIFSKSPFDRDTYDCLHDKKVQYAVIEIQSDGKVNVIAEEYYVDDAHKKFVEATSAEITIGALKKMKKKDSFNKLLHTKDKSVKESARQVEVSTGKIKKKK